ncbi:hypothetical protein D3H35_12095 [Cohnella faecalis]|uniref:Uncharacterized protein n=1 Tax=Cohnella faecalis TaxID=2315694 RepID=A0A398CJB4_9BACL|nr:hypothetical protein D3H35_12095 [Cohnella faecalis]
MEKRQAPSPLETDNGRQPSRPSAKSRRVRIAMLGDVIRIRPRTGLHQPPALWNVRNERYCFPSTRMG